jgi:aryl-alcohol dehydrogenase-like predicted oxidoreductase
LHVVAQGTRVNRANILESVDKSLKRLGVDHIDLLQARACPRGISALHG